jgi:putative Holliday junction resolvase
LAVDLGTRRIGIALSDPTCSVAMPLDTLTHRERWEDLAAIAALARSHEVGRIVVGWPRNMDGTSGPAAKHAEAFAEALRRLVPVPGYLAARPWEGEAGLGNEEQPPAR